MKLSTLFLGLASLISASVIPHTESTSVDASTPIAQSCTENATKCAGGNPGGAVFICHNNAWDVLVDCGPAERCDKSPSPHCTWSVARAVRGIKVAYPGLDPLGLGLGVRDVDDDAKAEAEADGGADVRVGADAGGDDVGGVVAADDGGVPVGSVPSMPAPFPLPSASLSASPSFFSPFPSASASTLELDTAEGGTPESAICRGCRGIFQKCLEGCYWMGESCNHQCNAHVCQTHMTWGQTCKRWCRWPCY